MLATVLFTSYTKFNLARPDCSLQSLWALGVGTYALLLVNQLVIYKNTINMRTETGKK